MDPHSAQALQHFRSQVGLKFQLYNSLFTALPFHRIEKTGVLLSLLLNHCEEGYKKKQSPEVILEDFFQRYTTLTAAGEKADLLFRFTQYIERQVVLFDALEDAAFREVNDMNGAGTLKHLESEAGDPGRRAAITDRLQDFAIRLVLTAHPTQFYPGSVLGIIHDLSRALNENSTTQVNTYLQQLGKTPFFNKQKPTPYDEAVSLIWYLEHVFYNTAGRILSVLRTSFGYEAGHRPSLIQMGFWPGGDRDGNPHVTADITLKVAASLRAGIIRCYYREVGRLKRRLTFQDVDSRLAVLESRLYQCLIQAPQEDELTQAQILAALQEIREIIVHQHNGLFLHLVDTLIGKVQAFGLYFAALDVRQESSVHAQVLEAVADSRGWPADWQQWVDEGRSLAGLLEQPLELTAFEGLVRDTLESFGAIRSIQETNGEEGCHRYVISQCHSARHVLEVYALFLLTGWSADRLPIDIVPLFETIDDLKGAARIMEELYTHPVYRKHLAQRNMKQVIMVGFSDGTKDGGYLMANWSIYKAKEELTALSRRYEVEVVFFDGRGGPPARGGGKTHKFYASMGSNIASNEIQVTIQGQTVSSNFGTDDAARYNIEQLLHAGLRPKEERATLEPEADQLLTELAEASYRAYVELKEHPDFIPYLQAVSPLNYYGETNIGSRPVKRGGASRLQLKDLRAIPFVGAWSQLKQNVTGYYGMGAALQELEARGKMPELKQLYRQSPFFRALVDNCEMAMKKCFFPLTAALADDPRFGPLWKMIHEEYDRTERFLFQLTGRNELMANYPVEALSIQMRERIVLPLATIQQYALARLRASEGGDREDSLRDAYGRLVVRSSFGLINAGRNSA